MLCLLLHPPVHPRAPPAAGEAAETHLSQAPRGTVHDSGGHTDTAAQTARSRASKLGPSSQISLPWRPGLSGFKALHWLPP